MTEDVCQPGTYDRILVAFSGGKDSLAALLLLLDQGLGPHIELHHHDVDGGRPLMDWPVTPAYCRAIAHELGLPIYFSQKDGGFEREMLRNGNPTAPMSFDTPEGRVQVGGKGPPGVRLRFPAVQADLRVRWCSAYLKIDVFSALLRNDPRFEDGRTLVVTGERAEESSNRARYKAFESHRATSRRRHIDHWRPIHSWGERRVWEIIRRYGVLPHPAYEIGWGRLSCRHCIFGSPDQWASAHVVDPRGFAQLAQYERDFRHTVRNGRTLEQMREQGKPYPGTADAKLVARANATEWRDAITVPPLLWTLPAGAMSEDRAGPV